MMKTRHMEQVDAQDIWIKTKRINEAKKQLTKDLNLTVNEDKLSRALKESELEKQRLQKSTMLSNKNIMAASY